MASATALRTLHLWHSGVTGPVDCPCGCGGEARRIDGGFSTPSGLGEFTRGIKAAYERLQAQNPAPGS